MQSKPGIGNIHLFLSPIQGKPGIGKCSLSLGAMPGIPGIGTFSIPPNETMKVHGWFEIKSHDQYYNELGKEQLFNHRA